jgi:dUTP pyrophosphatase
MPKKRSVNRIVEEATKIFWERNKKYGNAGMDIGKAAALASTKLDRIRNSGIPGDSAIDLLNYAIILLLLERDEWNDMDPVEDRPEEPEETGPVIMLKRTEAAMGQPKPEPKKPGDVGYDLYTTVETVIPPMGASMIPVETGCAVKIPDGYWLDLRGRSSAAKRNLLVVPSVIDTGYTGPLFSCVWNMTKEPVTVLVGDRLAQLVLHKAIVLPVVDVDVLPETVRGASGFGSTGN